MGNQRLKIKDDLNYRAGGESASCDGCDYLVRTMQLTGIGGADLGKDHRCRVIGLNPSRKYKINPKSICNRFANDLRLMNLMGEPAFERLYGKERLETAQARKREFEEIAVK